MSQSHQQPSNDPAENDTQRTNGKEGRVNGNGDSEYQPAFNRVELTEIRAPFWGIANNAMDEYFEERR